MCLVDFLFVYCSVFCVFVDVGDGGLRKVNDGGLLNWCFSS